jgi:hypothetical protein
VINSFIYTSTRCTDFRRSIAHNSRFPFRFKNAPAPAHLHGPCRPSPVQPLTWPKGQGRSARLARSMFVPGGSKSRRSFDLSVPASSDPHINQSSIEDISCNNNRALAQKKKKTIGQIWTRSCTVCSSKTFLPDTFGLAMGVCSKDDSLYTIFHYIYQAWVALPSPNQARPALSHIHNLPLIQNLVAHAHTAVELYQLHITYPQSFPLWYTTL